MMRRLGLSKCAECGHLHWDAVERAYEGCPVDECNCAGQCVDCGRPIFWDDNEDRQHFTDPERGCFLIRPRVK